MPYGGGYGYGGGFGGSGVGGSIAQGLHAGFEMGRQVDLDKAAKEQREFENQRQTEADARAQQAADIATAHQGYLATNQLIAGHKARGAALAEQYNGQVPEDVGAQYAQEGQGYLDTQKAHLQKIAGYVAAGKQQAQDDATNMAAGKLDPLSDKYPAKQLVHAFTATTRRPITDLLRGPNGEPAPVEQAGEDLHNGIKFGNEGMVLKAANTLFAPELQTGVGQPSPHGGTIIGKQIVKILPAPNDPNNPNDPNAGKVTPVIRVFVREGGGGGENYGNEGRNVQGPEQLQYGAPAGATGHYDAPVTQNRSTDPNDPIAHISMEDAMNRVEQLKAAAGSIAGDPRLRAKVDKGIEEGGTQHNTFLNAYRAMGGTMPGENYEDIKVPTLRLKKNAAGEVIGQEEFVPPEKAAEAKAPTLHNVIQGTQEQTLQWNPKTKKYEPIGAPGPRFKPAAEGMGKVMSALSKDQNEALFGEHGAVTEGRLDAGKVNSRTAGIFANAELTRPGMDYARMSGDIALGRNATFRQRAMTAEVLPEIMQNMVNTGKKVGFSDVKTIGKMQAWVKGELNDPDMAEYMSQRNDALMTIAGVMRSTGMSDMAHKAETEVASPTMSPAALDGWMRGQMKSLEPRLKINRAITKSDQPRGGATTPTKTPAGATVSNW